MQHFIVKERQEKTENDLIHIKDSSMNERPQLIRVLIGKMSLNGSKPLIPQEESVHRIRE